MQTTSKMVMRPPGDLIPYARNARMHSPAQVQALRGSLREFGFVTPVLIDGGDNVIAGHGRLEAALLEGIPLVPCVLVEHLTELQRHAYILAANRLAEQASWDEEMLAVELTELQDAGFDLELAGFDLDDLSMDWPVEVDEDDAFDPMPPVQPKAKRGEVYQLGRHRLMCGDATAQEDLAELLDGAQAHLLLTDPPYNVGVVSQTSAALTILNDDFHDEEMFCAFLQRALQGAVSVLEPGSAYYLWHPDGSQGWAFREACHREGLRVRQCLVWVKQAATLGRQDYQWQHEPCLHGQVEPMPQQDRGEGETLEHLSCLYGWTDGASHLWTADRKQTTVLQFDRPVRSEAHPTMKPVKLFAYQMANSTRPGARVLDLFAGSGTTVIAAEQLGRTAYLMELDPGYVDVIVARWETLTGEKASLVVSGP